MKKGVWLVAVGIVVALLGVWPAGAASVNNFSISQYDIEYYLSKDDANRSTLKTVETITANFPSSDQNHGLERALPLKYNGHTTDLEIASIVSGKGEALPYSSRDSNGNRVIRIGDKDTYVHGEQTYIITYTQRDVSRHYQDTAADEFYWDTNGLDWRVPIAQLRVTVQVDDSIASNYTRASCYVGERGATDSCSVERHDNPLVVSMQAYDLQSAENLTLALGFTSGTFAEYEPSTFEKIFNILLDWWLLALVIGFFVAVAIVVKLSVRWSRLHNRRKDIGTIVPEYLPPSNYSVLTSAAIVNTASRAFSAQVLDLAVRHYVKIYQIKQKTLWKSAEYELELVRSVDDLHDEEQQLMGVLFPARIVGSRFAMKDLQTKYSLGKAIRGVLQGAYTTTYGLRRKDKIESRRFRRWAWGMLAASVLTLSPVLLIAAVVVFVLAATLRPLTEDGLSLRRYLYGLEEYIKVAEVDRLKMLQSPEGAEKTGVTLADGSNADLVRLYERVLPYAVLFNRETEWNKQLGVYYESTNNQPDWYSGQGSFNAVAFGAAMNSFTAASSYASPSSSSSGGSSGGGYSGGGGGGGGGGGW